MPLKLKIAKGRKKALVKLPVSFLDAYLPNVNGDYLRIYLFCLKLCIENTMLTDAEIAKKLGMLKSDIKNAFKFWEKEGLVSFSEDGDIEFENPEEFDFSKPASVKGDYSGANALVDMFSVVKTNKRFKEAVRVIESVYCELLTQDDVLTIYDILEVQKIPLEVFMVTLSHCLENNKKRMKYIIKVILENQKNDLFTAEDVEEHFAKIAEKKEYSGHIKAALNIKGREFVETEKQFIAKWQDAGKTIEDIAAAYEKTVINTGKLSFPYMDKIIMNENGNKFTKNSSVKAGPLNNFTQETPDFNKIMDNLIKRQQE